MLSLLNSPLTSENPTKIQGKPFLDRSYKSKKRVLIVDNKEVVMLENAKYIAQHEPWWSFIFPRTAKKRSERARARWELYSKSLIMQAKDFQEIYHILNLCQTSSKARDGGIIKATNLANTIKELNMVSAKAGLDSSLQIYISSKRSEILSDQN